MKVFFLTPAPRVEFQLRRWAKDGRCSCDREKVCAWASVDLGELDEPLREAPHRYERASSEIITVAEDDPRWPTQCVCGYVFQADDERCVDTHRLYAGAPDGKLYSLRNAPVGAMWDAWWMRSGGYGRIGPDGLYLIVKTPGGDWGVDDRASNCTMPSDDVHRCWVRHGDPRTGVVHVDKNGNTCGAGAGSILCGGYHGFLHNGELGAC